MATSIGQHAPVFLPGSLTGHSPQGHKVRHYLRDPVPVDARLFLLVAALPQCELTMKVMQLLGLPDPVAPRVQGHGLPLLRELWRSQSLFTSLL